MEGQADDGEELLMRSFRIGRKAMPALLVAGALGLGAASPASAAVVTIKGTTDTLNCVISSVPFNTCDAFEVGPSGTDQTNTLLWFDVFAHVPLYSSVNSARLRVYYTDNPDDALETTGAYFGGEPWNTDATWTTQDGSTS